MAEYLLPTGHSVTVKTQNIAGVEVVITDAAILDRIMELVGAVKLE